MKRNQYRSKITACPFYKKEDRQTIFCHGVVGNSSIHIAFGNDVDCNDYKNIYCRGDFHQCPVCLMLEDVYHG